MSVLLGWWSRWFRRLCSLAALAVLMVVFDVGAAASALTGDGDWVNVSGSSSPPLGDGNTMDYDAQSRQLVWFGGTGASPGPSETWVWSGTNWSQLEPPNAPLYLYDPSMAFDSATNQMILFGGEEEVSAGYGPPQWADQYSTWNWDGSTWSELAPAHHPEPRYGAAMAYDPASGQLVLFGGSAVVEAGQPPVATHEMVNDTWIWDGSDWTQAATTAAPAARWGAGMTYDPRSGDLVLYGGNNGQGTYYTGTWEWNGHDWISVVSDNSTNNPGKRFEPSLAYDKATSQLIAFGGVGGSTGTWDWTGSSWVEVPTPVAPVDRWGAPLVYDPRYGNLLLAGGGGGSSLDQSNYTWSWERQTTHAGGGAVSSPSVTALRSGASSATTSRSGSTPVGASRPTSTLSPTGAQSATGGPTSTDPSTGKSATDALGSRQHSGASILWTSLLASALVIIVTGSTAGVYRQRRRRPPTSTTTPQ